MFIRKTALAILFLIVLTVSAYILIVVIPSRFAEKSYQGARNIAKDIRDALQFNPEIKVNNTIILGQEEDVFQLALMKQTFRHEYNWTNTWMGSTKKIRITGTFEAKAGFDLEKRFTLDIFKNNAVVTLPRATLLSVSPRHDIVFYDENGIWNWVDGADRTRAINAFTRDAHRFASKAKFIRNAESEMEKRLSEILSKHGKTVTFIYSNDAPVLKE